MKLPPDQRSTLTTGRGRKRDHRARSTVLLHVRSAGGTADVTQKMLQALGPRLRTVTYKCRSSVKANVTLLQKRAREEIMVVGRFWRSLLPKHFCILSRKYCFLDQDRKVEGKKIKIQYSSKCYPYLNIWKIFLKCLFC